MGMETDHSLDSNCWRVLQNYKVYQSAEFCGTNHEWWLLPLVFFSNPRLHLFNDHYKVFLLVHHQLKAGGEPIAQALYVVLGTFWNSSIIPHEQLSGLVIFL